MFPFVIHSETMTNRVPVIVTPNNGSTFGWQRAFHVTTSLQNLCMGHGKLADARDESGATNFSDLFEVARLIYLQNLGYNVPAVMLALPHVRESTMTERNIHWVVTKRNF